MESEHTLAELAELGRQAIARLGMSAEITSSIRERVRSERLEKEKALGLTGVVKRMQTIYQHRQHRWEVERRFTAAMYMMGASLRQLAGHFGCSPQTIQSRLTKEIPTEIREILAQHRRRTGAPLMGYEQFGMLRDEFFSDIEGMTDGTLGDTINKLENVEMETGESVSRICGGTRDAGTSTGREQASSGEPVGAAQAEGGEQDGTGESGR